MPRRTVLFLAGVVCILISLALFTPAKAQCQYDPYCWGWQQEEQRQREDDWRMEQRERWYRDYQQRERENTGYYDSPYTSPPSNDPYYDSYGPYDW